MTMPELPNPRALSLFRRGPPPPALELAGPAAGLYRAMAAIFRLGGFAAVIRATATAQKRVARENRAAVAEEGFIV
jgi:hypothetical protein